MRGVRIGEASHLGPPTPATQSDNHSLRASESDMDTQGPPGRRPTPVHFGPDVEFVSPSPDEEKPLFIGPPRPISATE